MTSLSGWRDGSSGRAGRPVVSARTIAAVAIGGAAGALARYGIESSWRSPWAIVAINVAGGLLIGMLLGLVARGRLPAITRPLLGIGFLGGFTTFSTAMLDLHDAMVAGRWPTTVLLCGVALVGAVAAAGLGWRITTAGMTPRGSTPPAPGAAGASGSDPNGQPG